MRLLLIGGTSEARELAAQLVADGIDVTSSLAGRVAAPRLPVGRVRVGGFGGVPGLRAVLTGFDVVVDASHPFALGISANARAACAAEEVPLLRLERPGWTPRPEWHYAQTHEAAATLAAEHGERPFLTVGKQALARFEPALGGGFALVRVVDRPARPLPTPWQLITSRGPYSRAGERDLMDRHRIDVLITKDSGGGYTWPKIEVAADLGVAVVVIRRPEAPQGIPVVDTVTDALVWIRGYVIGSGPRPRPHRPAHTEVEMREP